jgi:uncharacterized protein YndB with AHSA1/START domain
MAHAEHTVTIRRPIGDVFAYLADGRNNRHWRSGVVEIDRTSDADGEGATYRQVLTGPGGRRIDGDYRITKYEPPRTLEFAVVAGPARPTGRFELSESGAGNTNVRFSLDLQPHGAMRLMSGLITKTMRSEVASLDRLKTELER